MREARRSLGAFTLAGAMAGLLVGCDNRPAVERSKVDPEAAKKERDALNKARAKEWGPQQ